MQALPHAPQFAGSEFRSTHPPLQFERPVMQPVVLHAPAEHTEPAAHAFAHAPQLAGSLARFTQAPAHSLSPVAHTHIAAEQV
jgi:hypothetical protein